MQCEVVHLFSSATRERYRTDVLNACAYPEGIHYKWRYREKWVGTPDVDNLVGKKALLWYMDGEAGVATEYIPIRYAEITQVELQHGIIFIHFRVGQYVAPKSAYEEVAKEIMQQGWATPKDDKLVSIGIGLDSLATLPGSWSILTQRLASYKTFRGATFFRIGPIHRTAGKKVTRIDRHGAAKLIEGRWYDLDYTFVRHLDSEPSEPDVVAEVGTDGPIGLLTRTRQEFGSLYDNGTVRLRGESTPRSASAVLRLTARHGPDGATMVDLDLPIIISPKRLIRIGVLLLLLISGFFLSLLPVMPSMSDPMKVIFALVATLSVVSANAMNTQ